MRSAKSYQDIKTPEELEAEDEYDKALQAMLDEFDPEEAAANNCSFATYKRNCINSLNRRW